MSYPMQPYLIGAISDAIDLRLARIAAGAAETIHGDLSRQLALQAALIAEDLGNLPATDKARIEQACDCVKATFYDWWRQGRRIIRPGEIDADDLANGTHYLRLDESPLISVGLDEALHLEGAFISSNLHNGQRDWAVTILFSGDLERDLQAMSLKELTRHQANIVVSTWDADRQTPVTVFYGRPGISDNANILAAIEEIWSALTPSLGYGGLASRMLATPTPSSASR